jgi:hypothetical protein
MIALCAQNRIRNRENDPNDPFLKSDPKGRFGSENLRRTRQVIRISDPNGLYTCRSTVDRAYETMFLGQNRSKVERKIGSFDHRFAYLKIVCTMIRFPVRFTSSRNVVIGQEAARSRPVPDAPLHGRGVALTLVTPDHARRVGSENGSI